MFACHWEFGKVVRDLHNWKCCNSLIRIQPPVCWQFFTGFFRNTKGTVNNYFSLNFPCVFLRWFHGKLDRADAEKRLTNIGQVGSYLVRESDRRPGTYSLSYLGRNGISHFRVTGVCGDYYIGGRQFCSLNDLIGYYTAWSCLLKDEHLKFPVSPPEPVLVKKRVIAKYTYSKVPDTDELR